jgi:hypothetical protein
MCWVHGVMDQDGRRGALVHCGPSSGTTRRHNTRGRLWARLLAMRAPRGRGSRGEPHRGRRWVARGWSEAADELQRQRLFALSDKRLGAGRDKVWSGFGHGEKWMRRRGLLLGHGGKGIGRDAKGNDGHRWNFKASVSEGGEMGWRRL